MNICEAGVYAEKVLLYSNYLICMFAGESLIGNTSIPDRK